MHGTVGSETRESSALLTGSRASWSQTPNYPLVVTDWKPNDLIELVGVDRGRSVVRSRRGQVQNLCSRTSTCGIPWKQGARTYLKCLLKLGFEVHPSNPWGFFIVRTELHTPLDRGGPSMRMIMGSLQEHYTRVVNYGV